MQNVERIAAVLVRLAEAEPEQNQAPEAKLAKDPFKSLVGVMLSAQSRDAMTARARNKLFAVADTPAAILALPQDELAMLIKDCGLYNMKARNVHRMCRALLDEHQGVVPKTRAGLMSLPGVGRKCADIMTRFVYNQPDIPVDTHVFRVSRRLELADGRTEAKVAEGLDRNVPERYRWGAHMWLLNHGKRYCRARAPRCKECPLADLCPSAMAT